MRSSQPWRTNRARVLRSAQSSAEAKLWERLRNRQLGGYKFARQTPVEEFFADFVCRERKLIVEIDGGTHATIEEMNSDARRDSKLAKLGFRVLRVRNHEIYENIDGVLDTLLSALKSEKNMSVPSIRCPSPRPSPRKRGEGEVELCGARKVSPLSIIHGERVRVKVGAALRVSDLAVSSLSPLGGEEGKHSHGR